MTHDTHRYRVTSYICILLTLFAYPYDGSNRNHSENIFCIQPPRSTGVGVEKAPRLQGYFQDALADTS